jgi:hypothetical protein
MDEKDQVEKLTALYKEMVNAHHDPYLIRAVGILIGESDAETSAKPDPKAAQKAAIAKQIADLQKKAAALG